MTTIKLFRNMDAEEKKEEIADGMNVKVLLALDAQWVKIDDLIEWAKRNDMFEAQKAFVKLKNQKPLDEQPINFKK